MSLPRTWRGRAGFDCVVAVNRAIIVVDADWLSAGDIQTFTEVLPPSARPRSHVLTAGAHLDQVACLPTWSHLRFLPWHEVPLIAQHEDVGKPVQWSVQAALCLAAHLGAHEVHLFGADCGAGATADEPHGPALDCTGFLGANRGSARWTREAADIAVTTRLLAASGITLNRITIDR